MANRYVVTTKRSPVTGQTVYTVENTSSVRRKRTVLALRDALRVAVTKNDRLFNKVFFSNEPDDVKEEMLDVLQEKNERLLNKFL